MKVAYLESSAVLRVILEGDVGLGHQVDEHAVRVASELTFIEVERGITRALRERRIARSGYLSMRAQLASLEQTCEVLPIDRDIAARARQPFPIEPVRSLDAIHLATILKVAQGMSELVVYSTDRRVYENVRALARAHGYGQRA